MSGIARNLTASVAKLTSLFGRNLLYNSKQSYSTCWNCLKLGNVSTRFVTPIVNSHVRFNLYSTQNPKSQLLKYLDDEIAAEQESQGKLKPIPSKLGDFEVHLNGAEVTLVKETPEERIEINMNVSISTREPDVSEKLDEEEEETASLISKPPFEIEIKRGDAVLRLSCSHDVTNNGEYTDDATAENAFGIDEITIYKGKCEETNYAVEGGVLDEGVYEMLLNVLEEKGITNEFVMQLSELCTSYEHASYVGLLRDLKKFVS